MRPIVIAAAALAMLSSPALATRGETFCGDRYCSSVQQIPQQETRRYSAKRHHPKKTRKAKRSARAKVAISIAAPVTAQPMFYIPLPRPKPLHPMAYLAEDNTPSSTWMFVTGVPTAMAMAKPVYVEHPDGCPRVAFCGCGVAKAIYGTIVRWGGLAVAANWLGFPRAEPAPGMVAARRGHVFLILAMIKPGLALAYDPNSGEHQTKIHARKLAGFTVVNPRAGAKYASAI